MIARSGKPRCTTHRSLRVYGRVQGVYYRQSAKEQALRLGLTGFARNEPDGSVQIEVEGEDSAIDRFQKWCETGPPSARVERVETRGGELVGYTGFETRGLRCGDCRESEATQWPDVPAIRAAKPRPFDRPVTPRATDRNADTYAPIS